MVKATRHGGKKSLQQQLLRSKLTINKSRRILQKATLFSLKNKDKLLSRTIAVPKSFHLATGGKVNTIRTVHTSTGKSIASPPLGISLTTSKAVDPSGGGLASSSSMEAKVGKTKKKPFSIKKIFAKRKPKDPPSPSSTTPPIVKAQDAELPSPVSPATDILEPEDHRPLTERVVLKRTNSAETADVTVDTTPNTTPSRTDEASSLPATPSTTSSSASANHKKSPYIFTDDEEEPKEEDVDGIGLAQEETESMSDDAIEAKLDEEMKRLDERIRDQKAGERAIAKEQLDSDQSAPIAGPEDERASKGLGFCQLLALIIPIALFVALFTTPENHSVALERANAFFGTTEDPMEGVTVVVSETESRVGKIVQERFTRLGATVASIEVDCTDLATVSDSVDALLEQLGTIDFLIHTGSTCLSSSNQGILETMKFMTSTTQQAYPSLYAGNYLSSVLMTHKLLPYLEKSRYGTLVQFTSPYSKLVPGWHITPDSSTESSLPLINWVKEQKSLAATIVTLPLQYCYAKLSEVLHHRVIARDYRNIRTMEVSEASNWIDGPTRINGFFAEVFQPEPESRKVLSSEAMNDEDLRDDFFAWSQKAVWEWVAPPTPTVGDILLGRGEADSSVSNERVSNNYLPSAQQTLTVMTSGAIAMMAMKASSWSPGSFWWSSD